MTFYPIASTANVGNKTKIVCTALGTGRGEREGKSLLLPNKAEGDREVGRGALQFRSLHTEIENSFHANAIC